MTCYQCSNSAQDEPTVIERIHVRGRFAATRMELDYRVLVISISDPDSDPSVFKLFCVMDEKDVLRLRFHDVCLHQWSRAELNERWPDCKPMLPYHAKQIGPFLKARLREGVTRLLIHCEAGLSRSPSIAMAICDSLGYERSIIDWKHPDADAPNQHVYGLCVKALISCVSGLE